MPGRVGLTACRHPSWDGRQKNTAAMVRGSCVVHLMAILCVVHLMDFMGCICTTCVARSLKHVGISIYVSHQMRWPDFDVGIHTIRG